MESARKKYVSISSTRYFDERISPSSIFAVSHSLRSMTVIKKRWPVLHDYEVERSHKQQNITLLLAGSTIGPATGCFY